MRSVIPLVAAAEGVRDAGARRAHDDRPGANGVLRDAVLLPQEEVAVALEDDEDLLLGSVAVRRRVELAGEDLGVADPGPAEPSLAARDSGRGVRPSSPSRSTASRSAMWTMLDGRGESSPTSGGPAAASRVQG